ncbi:MAG: thiol-disulfide oxidoreductase DCC family protein [Flavobacteriales bacterium]
MFLIGVGLHFGILLVFPIPLFALTYISIYLLLIPISFWDYVFKSKKSYKKKLSVFYDAECPLCVRTKLVVTHFDSRNRIEFKTVQSDSINNSALKKYDKENLLSDIHCVDQKGKVRKGIDTYIKILNLIWWTRPISLFLRLPGIYQLAKKLYEFIAVNRNTKRCTEDNCGYNPPNIINNDTLKILKNFTISDLKKYVLVLILISFCTFQSLAIYKSPMVRNLKLRIAYADTTVDKVIMRISTSILNKSKVFFGITPHAVFIDNIHYKNYNHIIAIVHRDQNGSEKWLPITNKDGYVDTYAYGTNWAFYGFRVNSANINPESLISGIERYTAFWAHKNQINLEDAKFIIKVKKIDSPKEWKKDFLNKQIDKPWQDGGYVLWKDKEMSSFVYDIEAI